MHDLVASVVRAFPQIVPFYGAGLARLSQFLVCEQLSIMLVDFLFAQYLIERMRF